MLNPKPNPELEPNDHWALFRIDEIYAKGSEMGLRGRIGVFDLFVSPSKRLKLQFRSDNK